MVTTIIDDEIVKTWFKNWPKTIPEGGSSDENRAYQNFFDFLHKDTNLEVVNYIDDKLSIIYTQLTSNRGEKAKVKLLDKKFEAPFKCKFNINDYFKHIVFINEENEENRKKYLRKNQIPIGFKDNYLEVFKRVDLWGKRESLPVRENSENRFRSWNTLQEYLCDFSDVVIVDSFLLKHEETFQANLFEILRQISHKAKEKEGSVNVLLVAADWSYTVQGKTVRFDKYEDLYYKIKNEFIDKEAQNIKLGIAFLGEEEIKKEHDRTILFNFLRIKSGDSFTYFKTNGDYLTVGTEIDFHKQTRTDYCDTYDSVTKTLKEKLSILRQRNSNRLQGNITNRLIGIECNL